MIKEYLARWELKTQKEMIADEAHIKGDYYEFQISLIKKRLIDYGRKAGAIGFVFTKPPQIIDRRYGGFDAEFIYNKNTECYSFDCAFTDLIDSQLFKSGAN